MLNALLVASFLAVTLPPEPANHISDQAQLLSASEKANLEAVFQTAFQTKGVKLGLLTLSELDDQPKVIAVRTLNYWNMSPDSVLLLVSLNPKKIYLQPGENLASTFDERTSTAITRSMVPAMKNGQFGQAVTVAFDGIMVGLGGVNTGIVPAAPQPQVQRAAPVPQAHPLREPVPAAPIEGQIFKAQEQSGGHGFLIFLLIAGTIGVLAYLAYRQYQANQRRATRRTGGFTPNRTYDPYTGVRASGGGDGNDGLLTGLVVGSMLNQPAPVVAAPVPVPVAPRAPVYTPPPSPPSPPKRSSSILDSISDALSSGSSSRGSGGGGSSWGSSSSDSSSGSGGGGSDWGSSSGGGSDSGSSSGGGGGGSDW